MIIKYGTFQLSISYTFLTRSDLLLFHMINDQWMIRFSMLFLSVSQKCWHNSGVVCLTLVLEDIAVFMKLVCKSVYKCILCKTVVVTSWLRDWWYSLLNFIGILVPCLNNFLLRDKSLHVANKFRLVLGFLFRQDSVVVWFHHVGKTR